MKCCLKTENDCLKTYTTHPILMDVFLLKKKKKKGIVIDEQFR